MSTRARQRRPFPSRRSRLASAIPALGLPISMPSGLHGPEREPSVEELRTIEAEWPTYAAYLAVVDAECRFLTSPDVVNRRALRRAEVALARALADHANHTPEPPDLEQGVEPCTPSLP